MFQATVAGQLSWAVHVAAMLSCQLRDFCRVGKLAEGLASLTRPKLPSPHTP